MTFRVWCEKYEFEVSGVDFEVDCTKDAALLWAKKFDGLFVDSSESLTVKNLDTGQITECVVTGKWVLDISVSGDEELACGYERAQREI